jgi:hypothetical protein
LGGFRIFSVGISRDVYITYFIEFGKSRADMRRYEVNKKKTINNFFTHLNMFSMSIIQVLVDAAVHSEDEKVIKCDFKPGSVKRSIDG